MRYIKYTIFLIAALLVAVFAANNKEMVHVNFYPLPLKLDVAAFILFFVAILLGVIIGGTYQTFRAIYWKRVANTTKKKLDTCESELKEEKNKHESPSKNLWLKN